jgi:hypothetical protein
MGKTELKFWQLFCVWKIGHMWVYQDDKNFQFCDSVPKNRSLVSNITESQNSLKITIFLLWKLTIVFYYYYRPAPLRYYDYWIFVKPFKNSYYNAVGTWMYFMWNLRILLQKYGNFGFFYVWDKGSRTHWRKIQKNFTISINHHTCPIFNAENDSSILTISWSRFWPCMGLVLYSDRKARYIIC